MRTGLLLLCGALAGSSTLAEESAEVRKVREELERQLTEFAQVPAPTLLIEYVSPPGLGYRVLEAEFYLDGVRVPGPSPAELNGDGPHTIFAGEVRRGRREIVSRIVFVESASVVFTYLSGFRWKLAATTAFDAPSGLAFRVRVAPAVNPAATDAKDKLKLKYDLAMRLLRPVASTLAAPPDAGRPDAGALDAGTPDAGTPDAGPAPVQGTLRVVATAKKKPLPVQVSLWGEDAPSTAVAPSAEPVALRVTPGPHLVEVAATGMLAQSRSVLVAEGAEVPVLFELAKAPKKPLVQDLGKALVLAKAPDFLPGKAQLAPSAAQVVAQVVDAVVRGHIKKLRVEVHTDNQGEKEALLKRSQEQADSVAQALMDAGLAPTRLEARGLGDTQPQVPNLTAKGRARNRRVELIVVER